MLTEVFFIQGVFIFLGGVNPNNFLNSATYSYPIVTPLSCGCFFSIELLNMNFVFIRFVLHEGGHLGISFIHAAQAPSSVGNSTSSTDTCRRTDGIARRPGAGERAGSR